MWLYVVFVECNFFWTCSIITVYEIYKNLLPKRWLKWCYTFHMCYCSLASFSRWCIYKRFYILVCVYFLSTFAVQYKLTYWNLTINDIFNLKPCTKSDEILKKAIIQCIKLLGKKIHFKSISNLTWKVNEKISKTDLHLLCDTV